MMAEIINLRRVRKRARKEMDEKEAAGRRVEFGRSKAERTLSESEQKLAARQIDGHKLSKLDDEA
jgi:hypothetical protein